MIRFPAWRNKVGLLDMYEDRETIDKADTIYLNMLKEIQLAQVNLMLLGITGSEVYSAPFLVDEESKDYGEVGL